MNDPTHFHSFFDLVLKGHTNRRMRRFVHPQRMKWMTSFTIWTAIRVKRAVGRRLFTKLLLKLGAMVVRGHAILERANGDAGSDPI